MVVSEFDLRMIMIWITTENRSVEPFWNILSQNKGYW
jgi:hypothetical protein